MRGCLNKLVYSQQSAKLCLYMELSLAFPMCTICVAEP